MNFLNYSEGTKNLWRLLTNAINVKKNIHKLFSDVERNTYINL